MHSLIYMKGYEIYGWDVGVVNSNDGTLIMKGYEIYGWDKGSGWLSWLTLITY